LVNRRVARSRWPSNYWCIPEKEVALQFSLDVRVFVETSDIMLRSDWKADIILLQAITQHGQIVLFYFRSLGDIKL
jgi:hypothetical protein